MTASNKFMFTEALTVLAFAYAAKSYTAAAIFTSCCAVLYSIAVNGTDALRKDALMIIAAGILEGMMIKGCGMQNAMPSLASVALASLITADIWMASHAKRLRKPIRHTVRFFFLFVLLTMLIPDPVWGTKGTVLIITLLFVPYLGFYAVCRQSAVKHHTHTLKAGAQLR